MHRNIWHKWQQGVDINSGAGGHPGGDYIREEIDIQPSDDIFMAIVSQYQYIADQQDWKCGRGRTIT